MKITTITRQDITRQAMNRNTGTNDAGDTVVIYDLEQQDIENIVQEVVRRACMRYDIESHHVFVELPSDDSVGEPGGKIIVVKPPDCLPMDIVSDPVELVDFAIGGDYGAIATD